MDTHVAQGWLTTNRRISYPFKDNALLDDDARSLFVDAALVFGGHTPSRVTLDLLDMSDWLGSSSSSGGLQGPRVVLSRVDCEDVLFDSDEGYDEFHDSALGVYRTLHWVRRRINPSSGVQNRQDLSLTLVINTDSDIYGQEVDLSAYSAEFVDRAVQRRPDRVDLLTALGVDLYGKPILEEGYNLKLEVNPDDPSLPPVEPIDDGRVPTRIRISAEAGAGKGRKPADCDSQPILTINGTSPWPNGNFLLSGLECYWLERPLSGGAINPANTLYFNNDCGACCGCDQYELSYTDLVCLIDHAKLSGQWAERIRDDLTTQVEAFVSSIGCTDTCSLSLRVIPRRDWYVRVQAVLGNNGDCIIPDACFKFTVTSTATAAYEPSTGFIYTDSSQNLRRDPDVAGNVFTMRAEDPIRPGRYAIVTLDLRFTGNRSAGMPVQVFLELCDDMDTACGDVTRFNETTLLGPRNRV